MALQRRRNRQGRKPPTSRRKGPLIDHVGKIAGIAANLVTAAAGAGAFCLYLWSVHAGYVKERDPQFTGEWINTSEGCIGCPVDDNDEPIKLSLNVSNGDVSGEIYINDPFNEAEKRKIKKKKKESAQEIMAHLQKSYTNYFMIEGELTFYGGTIYLFDYRFGEKTYFGKAKIKLKNGGLYMETVGRAYDTIPLKVVFNPPYGEEKEVKKKSSPTPPVPTTKE